MVMEDSELKLILGRRERITIHLCNKEKDKYLLFHFDLIFMSYQTHTPIPNSRKSQQKTSPSYNLLDIEIRACNRN
jgi:hypothetical protein